jgi:hypothetical protein
MELHRFYLERLQEVKDEGADLPAVTGILGLLRDLDGVVSHCRAAGTAPVLAPAPVTQDA